MDGFDIVIVMLAVIWVAAGQVGPWIVMRSKGIRLSFLEYSSPLIKKSIFAIDHNIIVFDALQMIQSNNLDISIRELEEMYNANMDFNEIVDVLLLARNRNVNVSKEVLRELAYLKKDLRAIVNAKNAGEEVILTEVVRNYVVQKPISSSVLDAKPV